MDSDVVRVYRPSALADYSICPRKCYWRWFHDPPLEPKERSDNIQIGSCTHNCLHLWYKHNAMSIDERQVLVRHYLDTDATEQFTEGQIAEARRLMECLIQEYPEETFTVVRPETTILVRLIEDADVFIKLTVDGVIQLQSDKKPAPMLVLEHKTSSQARGPVITSYLKSPQIICYTWATKEKLGYPVVGAMFNFLVKTKTPQIMRLPTAISPRLQKRWLRSALLIIADIEDLLENDGHWRENLGACNTIFGRCQYDPLCTRYNEASLDNFQPASPDPVREDLVIQP